MTLALAQLFRQSCVMLSSLPRKPAHLCLPLLEHFPDWPRMPAIACLVHRTSIWTLAGQTICRRSSWMTGTVSQCRTLTQTRQMLQQRMGTVPWASTLPSPSAGEEWLGHNQSRDGSSPCGLDRAAHRRATGGRAAALAGAGLPVHACCKLLVTRSPGLAYAKRQCNCVRLSTAESCLTGQGYQALHVVAYSHADACLCRLYAALGRQLDERSVLLLYNLLHSCQRFRNYLHVCG